MPIYELTGLMFESVFGVHPLYYQPVSYMIVFVFWGPSVWCSILELGPFPCTVPAVSPSHDGNVMVYILGYKPTELAHSL